LRFSFAKALKDIEAGAKAKKKAILPRTQTKVDFFKKNLDGLEIDDDC